MCVQDILKLNISRNMRYDIVSIYDTLIFSLYLFINRYINNFMGLICIILLIILALWLALWMPNRLLDHAKTKKRLSAHALRRAAWLSPT
jgi:fumarate reductase subunit D